MKESVYLFFWNMVTNRLLFPCALHDKCKTAHKQSSASLECKLQWQCHLNGGFALVFRQGIVQDFIKFFITCASKVVSGSAR